MELHRLDHRQTTSEGECEFITAYLTEKDQERGGDQNQNTGESMFL